MLSNFSSRTRGISRQCFDIHNNKSERGKRGTKRRSKGRFYHLGWVAVCCWTRANIEDLPSDPLVIAWETCAVSLFIRYTGTFIFMYRARGLHAGNKVPSLRGPMK